MVAQTPSGAGDATLNNGFAYRALSITCFVPPEGPTAGLASPDDSIEIFGTSLNNDMTLSSGGANATGIACSSDRTGC